MDVGRDRSGNADGGPTALERWAKATVPADLVHRPQVASLRSRLATAFCLGLLVLYLILLLPREFFIPTDDAFVIGFGILGVWRYSWWGVQGIRALIYRMIVYPRHCAVVRQIDPDPVSHVHCIVMSYKIDPMVMWAVYEALFRELMDYGHPATIIASVTHRSDVDLLEQLAVSVGLPAHIDVIVMFQDGTGKRSAMAEALRALARRNPASDSVCLFMDGDCRIVSGTLKKVLPFFQTQPDLGGATVDNRGITAGGPWAREWYDLRFAQRHMLMCSLSLSRRLLVLTGRFSAIRTRLATQASFIEQIERDEIAHWRLGRIRFLSGDDKSTWFWLLRHGWRMLYVPDARVDSFEELPHKTLLVSGLVLMKRWFGNMLRANGRSLALGPRRIGWFVWWALLDQRISMWTGLVGPIGAAMLSIQYGYQIALAYLLWVLGTRTILSSCLCLTRRRVAPHWPFLLIFNQLLGAALKVHLLFRLDQQKWTRQKVWGNSDERPDSYGLGYLLEITTLVGFLTVIGVYTGLIATPERSSQLLASQLDSPVGQGDWVMHALHNLPPGQRLYLPNGTFAVDIAALPESGYRIRGQGVARTHLRLFGAGHITCRTTEGGEGICHVDSDRLEIANASVIRAETALPKDSGLEGKSGPVPTPHR